MRLSDLTHKRVVIWGAGRETGAVLRAAERQGIHLDARIIDENDGQGTIEMVPVLRGANAMKQLETADVIIRSPGISRYRPELVDAVARGVKVTSATNLWFAEEYRNVIAVTGTKGKSTTSSLIAHLLDGVGKTAQLAGNIGQSPIDFVGRTLPDWWVLELSSFQTSDLTRSPDIAVLTTLSAEHLDWHGSYEHYRDDKLNLFSHNPSTISVVNMTDPGAKGLAPLLPHVVEVSDMSGVYIDKNAFYYNGARLFPASGLQLVGRHNLQLACLALTAVAQTGVSLTNEASALERALRTFEALPHRLAPISSFNNVLYVDDGLATVPAATMVALDAFADRPTTVLLGGHDRGISYEELGAHIAERTTDLRVLTMPANGERIAQAIDHALQRHPNDHVVINATTGLEDAVRQAAVITPPGGVVLLSPAAASFGAFRDYVERSDAFVGAVQNVIEQSSP